MSQNSNQQLNPAGSNPSGVDLLGQSGSESDQPDPRDFSNRTLKTTATIRQSVTAKGGQPR
jgi:hypothetical protein